MGCRILGNTLCTDVLDKRASVDNLKKRREAVKRKQEEKKCDFKFTRVSETSNGRFLDSLRAVVVHFGGC